MGSEAGLFENYTPAFNDGAPRDYAAQMLYNALFSYTIIYRDGIASIYGYNNEKNDTLGEAAMGLIEKFAVVAGNDKFSLTGTESGKNQTRLSPVSKVLNGDKAYKDNTDYIQSETSITFKAPMDLIGEEVKILYKESNSTATGNSNSKSSSTLDINDTIYGITKTGTTTVYNVTKGDMDDEDNEKVDLGKEAGKVKVADRINVYYNYYDNYTVTLSGSASKNATDLTNLLKKDSTDSIKFVTDNDGKIVYAFVTEKVYAKVTAVSSDKITFVGAKAIELDGNDIYSGAAVNDYAAVTVLYKAYKDMDDDEAVVTAVKADIVEGTMSALQDYKDGGVYAKKMKVDDTFYTQYQDGQSQAQLGTSDDFIRDNPTEDDLDETFTVILDGKNWVAYKASASTVKNYVVVTGADVNGLNASVKVLDYEGNSHTYTIDDDSDVQLTGGDINNPYDTSKNDYAFTYTDKSGTKVTDTSGIVGRIFNFSVQSNGEVRLKRVVSNSTEVRDGYSATSPASYSDKGKTFNGIATKEGAVAFIYMKDRSEWDAFQIDDLDSFTGATSVTKNHNDYAVNGSGEVLAFMVETSKKPSSVNNESYGYVTAKPYVSTTTRANDKYTFVEVWNGTETITLKVDDDGAAYQSIKKGDFVWYKLGANGLVDEDDIGNGTYNNNNDGKTYKAALKSYKTTRNNMQIFTSAGTVALGLSKNVKEFYVNADDTKGIATGSPTEARKDANTGNYVNNIVYRLVEEDGQWVVGAIWFDTDNDIEPDGAGTLTTVAQAPANGGSGTVVETEDGTVSTSLTSAAVNAASANGGAGVVLNTYGQATNVIAIAGLKAALSNDTAINNLETNTIPGMFKHAGGGVGEFENAGFTVKVDKNAKTATVEGTLKGATTKTSVVFNMVEAYSTASSTIAVTSTATTDKITLAKMIEQFIADNAGVKSVKAFNASTAGTAVTSGEYTNGAVSNLYFEITTMTGAPAAARVQISTLTITPTGEPVKVAMRTSSPALWIAAPEAADVFKTSTASADKASAVEGDKVTVSVPMTDWNSTNYDFELALYGKDGAVVNGTSTVALNSGAAKDTIKFEITVNATNKANLDGMYVKVTKKAAALTQTTIYVDTTAVNSFTPSLAAPINAPTTVGGSGKIGLTGVFGASGDPIYVEYEIVETGDTGVLTGKATGTGAGEVNFSAIGKNATSATTTIQLTKVVTLSTAGTTLAAATFVLSNDGTSAELTFGTTVVPTGATLTAVTGENNSTAATFTVAAGKASVPVVAGANVIDVKNVEYTLPYTVKIAANTAATVKVNGVAGTGDANTPAAGSGTATVTYDGSDFTVTGITIKGEKTDAAFDGTNKFTVTLSGGGTMSAKDTTPANNAPKDTPVDLDLDTFTGVTGALEFVVSYTAA